MVGAAVGDWQGGLPAADRVGHRKRKRPFGNLPALIAAGSGILQIVSVAFGHRQRNENVALCLFLTGTSPQKVGSKRSRSERTCKRAGEVQRDFLRRGATPVSAASGGYSEQGLAQRYRAIRRDSEKRDNIARG